MPGSPDGWRLGGLWIEDALGEADNGIILPTEITPGLRIKFARVPCSIPSCRVLEDGWLLGYIKVVFALMHASPSVTQ